MPALRCTNAASRCFANCSGPFSSRAQRPASSLNTARSSLTARASASVLAANSNPHLGAKNMSRSPDKLRESPICRRGGGCSKSSAEHFISGIVTCTAAVDRDCAMPSNAIFLSIPNRGQRINWPENSSTSTSPEGCNVTLSTFWSTFSMTTEYDGGSRDSPETGLEIPPKITASAMVVRTISVCRRIELNARCTEPRWFLAFENRDETSLRASLVPFLRTLRFGTGDSACLYRMTA